MKFIKLLLPILVIVLLMVAPRAAAFDLFPKTCTKVTSNSGTGEVCGPCKDNPNTPICKTNQKTNPVVDIINTAAGIIAILTGVIAVIMIIVSGFTLITSGGNTEAVTNSRRRLVYALVGVVVVALAFTITRFITDRLVQ